MIFVTSFFICGLIIISIFWLVTHKTKNPYLEQHRSSVSLWIIGDQVNFLKACVKYILDIEFSCEGLCEIYLRY